jgi:hypothetical protein
LACYPRMEHYHAVAKELGIAADEIDAAQSIVVAVSAGRGRAQFKEVHGKGKLYPPREDSCKC